MSQQGSIMPEFTYSCLPSLSKAAQRYFLMWMAHNVDVGADRTGEASAWVGWLEAQVAVALAVSVAAFALLLWKWIVAGKSDKEVIFQL